VGGTGQKKKARNGARQKKKNRAKGTKEKVSYSGKRVDKREAPARGTGRKRDGEKGGETNVNWLVKKGKRKVILKNQKKTESRD